MPIGFTRWQRREGVDRNDFALAALEVCRRARTNPKVRGARFYWHNASEITLLVDGELGFDDYNPDPDPEGVKAQFALDDLGILVESQTWGDAGAGTQTWETAGEPSGAR
jgi:hypothetical protein